MSRVSNRSAPLATGASAAADMQRLLADHRQFAADAEQSFVAIPDIGVVQTVPTTTGQPLALVFQKQNRVAIDGDGALVLPPMNPRDAGKPVWLNVLRSEGRCVLVPREALSGQTTTIDGHSAKAITAVGLYLLAHDGQNWFMLCSEGLNVYVPMGLPNEGAYFQRAILRAAATTGRLIVTAGTINLPDGDVTLYENLHLDMSPGTVLDISAGGSVDALIATGSEGGTLALTANAAKGATSITMSAPNAATLTFGDWIRVASNKVFDASDTNSELGELVKVKSVAAGVVTLETPLRGGPYNTADTAVASKVTPVRNIKVTGGRIVGGGTLTSVGADADCNGIRIFLGERCLIQGVRFERCDLSSVWFQDSTFCHVDLCHFQDAVNDNQAYGALWDNACQDCSLTNCTADRVRHLTTTGNSTSTKGIVRRITYLNNRVYSTTPARGGSGGDAIDTHGAAEDISIINNTVYSSSGGGINVECASAVISGNQVFDTTDYGIIYHNESDQNGEVSIIGNRVVNAGLGGTWEAIRVNNPTRGGGANVAFNTSVNVCGNQVINPTGIGIYVVNSAGASTTIQRNGSVSGNTVIGSGSASASIYLEDCTNFCVTGNTVADPTSSTQQCIQLRDCSNVTVSGNSIKHQDSNSGIGIYINASGTGTAHHITISGNTVYAETPVNMRGVYLDDTAQNVVVSNDNNFQKCNQEVRRGTGSGHDIPSDVLLSVTIASDAITINRNSRDVVVDTEGAAATDNLSTISGGTPGQIICLRSASSARDTTIKDGVGNILCGADFTLATGDDLMTLEFCSSNHWRRIASASN